MRQKVVVIGHGYTSRLGIIRSLAELDCEITVIAIVFHGWLGRCFHFYGGKPIDCHSKYVHRMFYCIAKNEQRLIKLLLEKCSDPTQKVIVIPDSDFSAAVIDKNQEQLKEFFLFPHINHTPGAVEHWMDKTLQKKAAMEIGMNVANGQIIAIKNHAYILPQSITYPCFVKPLRTVGGGKKYLKRCGNESELINLLDEVASCMDIEMLVEDYKTIDNEYAVVGFSDGENVTIPCVMEFVTNTISHFGVAREGRIEFIAGFEPLLSQLKEFVKRVGFCGLFDIDFYESDCKLYFGEMNLRFGASGYAVTKMGVNLPAMLVKHLKGEDYSGVTQRLANTATYVNERMCLDDWCYGHITENEFRMIIQKANIKFVYDDADMGPQIAFERKIKLFQTKRFLKKLLK